MGGYAIGADIGGSHISCALVDLAKGAPVAGTHSQHKVDKQASANAILDTWATAIKQSLEKVGSTALSGVGFAMPGPFAYDTGVAMFQKVAKYESLYGVNVAQGLAARLGLSAQVPLRFMNDASAFAVGEAWVGSAAKVRRSAVITLGTGFGSAFVLDGVPVVDGGEVPDMGCLWHLPFSEGIADDYFSTRWCIARWKELSGETVSGVRAIAEAVDANAKRLFEEFGSNIGAFLGPWLNQFKADLLVLGGNVTGAYHLFGPAFEQALQDAQVHTKPAISILKEDAAIIGAARMADPEYFEAIKPVLPKM